MNTKVTVEALVQHINSGVRLSNIDMDLRCDLVMCMGYSFEAVAAMTENEVLRIFDEEEENENFPNKYKNEYGIKCSKCHCEVGLEFVNAEIDYIASVCRCGHIDTYSEYYFDALDEAKEFNEALNATMKKVMQNVEVFTVISQSKNEAHVNEIREHGYKIQEFETTDSKHEFYMLDGEYWYLETSHVHKNTQIMKPKFKEVA